MKCLGLWFQGFGEGGPSIQCIAIFYYICVIGEVVEGGRGGKIQLQSCQNMIKPKRKDCGASPSPRPVSSNSFPSIEQTKSQSYKRVFPSNRRLGFSSKGAARLALSIRIYCSICLCALFCNLVQLTASQAGREESCARRPRPRLGEKSAR